MQTVRLRAYDVAQEIDLNALASAFEIKKKFTWEEPLTISGRRLAEMIGPDAEQDERAAMLFSFGAMVLINLTREESQRFVDAMRAFGAARAWKYPSPHFERFQIALSGEIEDAEFTDARVSVPEIPGYFPELAATVLAKSVALERVEQRIDSILDRLEPIVEQLERGKLSISNKQRSTIMAELARYQYATLSSIMVLDKPDMTWSRGDAEEFYNQMADFFELTDRYEVLKAKGDAVERIMGSIASMNDHSRSMFVEWVIIGLILVEVILMVLDLIRWF
jgi:uncharacterized Rmd1/YagE family protein